MKAILTSLEFQPLELGKPTAWVGHLPFAAVLVSELKPEIFVELGTHFGNSYFTFCQAVEEFKTSTQCYAVDTWEGEEHAGSYDESVYQFVSRHNDKNYQHFSRLLRTTFDDASKKFLDNSIGLLHIDGLHTYEAVANDFESWYPKIQDGGIILFHDICCRHDDFGVWKLWEEIQEKYPHTLSLLHSHGLGVLVKTSKPIQNTFISQLVDKSKATQWQRLFNYAAEKLSLEKANRILTNDLSVLRQVLQERDQMIAERDHLIAEQGRLLAASDHIKMVKEDKIMRMKNSFSWKITALLRALRRFINKT